MSTNIASNLYFFDPLTLDCYRFYFLHVSLLRSIDAFMLVPLFLPGGRLATLQLLITFQKPFKQNAYFLSAHLFRTH